MSSNPNPESETHDLAQMRAALFEEFESILRSQGGIDAADRDSMLRHFGEALNDPGIASAPVDFDRMQADVAQTLGLMQQHGLIDAAGSDEVSETFARTLQPLQDESLQRAVEFGRRCREDGQEAAREWLARQPGAERTQSGEGRPADAAPAHLDASLRSRKPAPRRRTR